MPAVEALCHLFGINPSKFTKQENLLLELEIFTRLCDKLQENFKAQYRDYFRIMKFTQEMENAMIEMNFIKLIIKDILVTEEYTLEGIATYTNVPTEMFEEMLIGSHINPSAILVRKLMELHRTVRKELYISLAEKIHTEYLAA